MGGETAPGIGDWLVPRDGTAPGVVVDILPSGESCVLSRRLPITNIEVETVHETKDLKGRMTGMKLL